MDRDHEDGRAIRKRDEWEAESCRGSGGVLNQSVGGWEGGRGESFERFHVLIIDNHSTHT